MKTSADFACAVCGAIAATVTMESAESDGKLRTVIKVEGFLGANEGVTRGAPELIARALTAKDARALVDATQDDMNQCAPFHCGARNLVYCVEHWDVSVHSEDEDLGLYDHTERVCPRGHRQELND